MLFNSLQFLIFFPTVVAVFFLLPQRFRWTLLLAASYYFYMAWRPEYALLIMFSTVVDYLVALAMERVGMSPKRRLLLYGSLLVNLGMLFFFKYFNFFSESAVEILNSFNIFYQSPTFSILLPVGISFYIFQSLSYTIDVYRGVRPAERHLGIFALYVSFFPQLVAGPIERSTHLLPQFYRKVTWNTSRVVSGLRLMLWGYFLKMVIADNAGGIVTTVYGDPVNFNGLALMLATFFFAMQIFGDFAGYSYIAIGTARILGYDLIENFRRPYFARSIAEFWRRWHISLMNWFRAYVYIPLGGSRVSRSRWARNIAAVFLLSGLWHGAAWTFVAWGAFNGLLLVLSKYTESLRRSLVRFTRLKAVPALHTALQIALTFSLVCIGWVFFRAQTLSEAVIIIYRMVVDVPSTLRQLISLPALTETIFSLGIGGRLQFMALCTAIAIMFAVQVFEERGNLKTWFARLPQGLRFAAYYALLLFIVFFGFAGAQPFFYFQF